jgi:hypothetical protein
MNREFFYTELYPNWMKNVDNTAEVWKQKMSWYVLYTVSISDLVFPFTSLISCLISMVECINIQNFICIFLKNNTCHIFFLPDLESIVQHNNRQWVSFRKQNKHWNMLCSIICEAYKLWRSEFCSCLQLHTIFPCLGANIVFNTLFPNSPDLSVGQAKLQICTKELSCQLFVLMSFLFIVCVSG